VSQRSYRDGIRDERHMTTVPEYDNSVRIGYARVSTRAQEHQAQLDALAAAHCREIITETASTRGDRPRLRESLAKLQAGDTLVVYKPDRVARSMKKLLVLLEDQLHARGINLHILTGICAGMHRPDGAIIADKMLLCRPGGDEGAEPGGCGAGRVITRDEHGGGGRAAAAGPGTRRVTSVIAGAGLSVCHPPGDPRRPDSA
jgi:hypothetical protein